MTTRARRKRTPARRARTKKPRTRIEELDWQIKEIDELAREARLEGEYSAAVAAQGKAGQLREARNRLHKIVELAAEVDPVRRLQLQRLQALADGSHVAAASVAKVEAELLAASLRAKADQAATELTDLTKDALVGIMVAALPSMDRESLISVLRAAALALEVEVPGVTDLEDDDADDDDADN